MIITVHFMVHPAIKLFCYFEIIFALLILLAPNPIPVCTNMNILFRYCYCLMFINKLTVNLNFPHIHAPQIQINYLQVSASQN